MSDSKYKSFPSTKAEALTLLYLQKQDLVVKNSSPEELAKLYEDVYGKISTALKSDDKQQVRY